MNLVGLQLLDQGGRGMLDTLVRLYEGRCDGIAQSDAYYAFLREYRLLGTGGYELDDAGALRICEDIAGAVWLPIEAKLALWDALEVMVINHHRHGQAADCLDEIRRQVCDWALAVDAEVVEQLPVRYEALTGPWSFEAWIAAYGIPLPQEVDDVR